MRALQDILDEMKHEIEKVCIIMPDVGAKLDELADEMDQVIDSMDDDLR